MTDALLAFLNSQPTDDFVLINDVLKTDEQYKTKTPDDLHQYLSKLVLAGKIEFKDNRHTRIGQYGRLNDGDYQNSYLDLDNWKMYARITEPGKEKIQSSTKMWYDTENARRQFEDYPKTKQRAINAYKLSIISIIVTIILGLLKWKCN